jgi:hypothetical protein
MFGFAQMKQRAAPTLRPLRRRPKQSRAKQTSLALQDAFVRLMSEPVVVNKDVAFCHAAFLSSSG